MILIEYSECNFKSNTWYTLVSHVGPIYSIPRTGDLIINSSFERTNEIFHINALDIFPEMYIGSFVSLTSLICLYVLIRSTDSFLSGPTVGSR